MSDHFYRAFEDLHRGQRHDIMRRLQVYLSFVLPVAQAHPDAICLDLGCGRGEWLQLLTEFDVLAQGVDLDAGMLEAARAQGLRVRHANALQALRDTPDDSVAVVTAFHLVEHLCFNDIQVLVAQAHRILLPGGLLILETPNPDNLLVASCNFHLDPSHIKPIPSQLLSFVTEHAGFGRTKVLGLQESPTLHYQRELELQDVLAGASPDYAVVSQKMGTAHDLERIASAFGRIYGISTAELARTYTHQQTKTIKDLRQEIQRLHDQQKANSEKIQAARAHTMQVETNIHAHVVQVEMQIQAIYRSSLWRLIQPLQWLENQIEKISQHGIKARLSAFFRKIDIRKSKNFKQPPQ